MSAAHEPKRTANVPSLLLREPAERDDVEQDASSHFTISDLDRHGDDVEKSSHFSISDDNPEVELLRNTLDSNIIEELWAKHPAIAQERAVIVFRQGTISLTLKEKLLSVRPDLKKDPKKEEENKEKTKELGRKLLGAKDPQLAPEPAGIEPEFGPIFGPETSS
jgi:hypothetical protein